MEDQPTLKDLLKRWLSNHNWKLRFFGTIMTIFHKRMHGNIAGFCNDKGTVTLIWVPACFFSEEFAASLIKSKKKKREVTKRLTSPKNDRAVFSQTLSDPVFFPTFKIWLNARLKRHRRR